MITKIINAMIESLRVPLKVKLLTRTAVKPNKAHPSDAGFDICSDETVTIAPMERKLISTGVAVGLESNMAYVRVAPRSGMSIKKGINVLGGVVDSGYRGEVKVILHNTDTEQPVSINIGDRIAQLVITPIVPVNEVQVVDELPISDRGENGFGHTGD